MRALLLQHRACFSAVTQKITRGSNALKIIDVDLKNFLKNEQK
jgi:Trp operon repressor